MIATNDLEKATREAAKDRAHIACIDKIAELEKLNKSIVDANHLLIDTQDRLQGECGRLEGENKQLKQSLAELQAAMENGKFN